jgi:hypothetical protein
MSYFLGSHQIHLLRDDLPDGTLIGENLVRLPGMFVDQFPDAPTMIQEQSHDVYCPRHVPVMCCAIRWCVVTTWDFKP